MEENNQTFYIIDTYSTYHQNNDVCIIFSLYNKWYCVRKINKLEWGQPVFDEKDLEDDYSNFYLYNSLEEAKQYIHVLKTMEGSHL